MTRRRAVVALLAFLALSLLTFGGARWIVDRRAEARLARLRVLADDELKALESRRFMRPPGEGPWQEGNTWDCLRPLLLDLSTQGGAEIVRKIGTFWRAAPGAPDAAAMRELVRVHAPSLDRIREAQQCADYTWTDTWREPCERSWRTQAGARQAAQILRLRAHFALEDGDASAAVDDMLAVATLAHDLQAYPSGYARFSEAAALRVLNKGVRELLSALKDDEMLLRRLAEGLSRARRRSTTSGDSVRFEWAHTAWWVADPAGDSGDGGGPPPRNLEEWTDEARSFLSAARWLWSDMAMNAEFLDCYASQAGIRDAGRPIPSPHQNHPANLSCGFVAGLGAFLDRWMRDREEAAVLEAAARVRLHRLKHGVWPSSLAEVPEAPSSPGSAAPPEYKVLGSDARISAPDGTSIDLSP